MAEGLFSRLIDQAFAGKINLIILKSKEVTEKEGKKFYVVDSIHYIMMVIAYHPDLGDYEGIEHSIEPLKEPLLVPKDFNARTEEEKRAYLLFFEDILPYDVIDILTTDDPRPVVLVAPPHLSEEISEEIRLRYEELEDFAL